MKNEKHEKLPVLHIYPQKYHHDEAIMIGTRAAFEKLKKTIEKVLEEGEAESLFVDSDYESYELHIIANNEMPESVFWSSLKLPYETDIDNQKMFDGQDYLGYDIRTSTDIRESMEQIENDRKYSKKMEERIRAIASRKGKNPEKPCT